MYKFRLVLFGYLMPVWFTAFGIISENYLSVTEPVYYGVVSYVMGVISTLAIFYRRR